MRTISFTFIILAAILAGCDNKELEQKNDQLTQELASRDAFIEEITTTISEINEKLDKAWAMEKNIIRQAKSVEGNKSMTQTELKQHILSRISDINSSLTENRKKVTDLQKRLKGATTQYAGLESMVEGLRKNLEEREKSLAEFQMRMENLESEIGQKSQIIAAHEVTIADKTRELNTVYYVAGHRDELKEKGIIEEDGGFLWGLLGSTTILASNFDDGLLTTLDRTKEMTIEIPGEIDEIIPRRDPTSYSAELTEDQRTILKVLRPSHFWRENRLVVVME